MARRASLGGASSSNKGRLWLCTDLLLLGKPSRASGASHKIYERCAIGGGVMLARYREGVTLAPRESARGASYATSEVELREERITSWDRGYDGEGLQVWGATEGPYRFDRQSE